jgi:hypothetical protein
MEILDHFAPYTKLSIKINQIADFVLERGYVNRIVFHPIEEMPDVAEVPGILLRRRDTTPYATCETAHVVYSEAWPLWIRRIVTAKELAGVTMPEISWTRTREQVSNLTHGITLPNSMLVELAKVNPDLVADHSGMLLALAILVPRDARATLAPLYPKILGDGQIAALAEIPENLVPLVMGDIWGDVLERLCPN